MRTEDVYDPQQIANNLKVADESDVRVESKQWYLNARQDVIENNGLLHAGVQVLTEVSHLVGCSGTNLGLTIF